MALKPGRFPGNSKEYKIWLTFVGYKYQEKQIFHQISPSITNTYGFFLNIYPIIIVSVEHVFIDYMYMYLKSHNQSLCILDC